MKYEAFVEELLHEMFDAEEPHGLRYVKHLIYEAIEGDYQNDKDWAWVISVFEITDKETRIEHIKSRLNKRPKDVFARVALARTEKVS